MPFSSIDPMGTWHGVCFSMHMIPMDIKDWLVVSKIFYFHPYLGKISNLTNIFQRG